MKTEVIKMFKIAPARTTVDPIEVNKISIRSGYVIHPECCNEDTLSFAEEICSNYNSTFYKCWEQVENTPAESLLIDQLMHYASTYGSNFQAEPFIVNDNPVEVPYTSYTIIQPATDEEIFNRCKNMVTSGIALKSATAELVIECMLEYPLLCLEVDPNEILNKEARCIWYDLTDTTPTDKFELMRFLMYKNTGSPMIVKDKESIYKIGCKRYDLDELTRSQIESLSEIFYRFKPLFLAMRRQSDVNKKIVNQIRRLAKDNHKPFRAGFWETILNAKDHRIIKDVRERVGELSNFKLVQLIQAARERLISSNVEGPTMYQIRNGKIFLKENECQALDSRYYFYEEFMGVLAEQLIKNLSKKACTVKFPQDVTLACPSSEKNFIGAYPFGTRFAMKDKNFIGVYWRNEWGTRDFDLSSIDISGNKVGWNTSYRTQDNSLVYSGDMTNADPEATEYLLCKGNCPDSVIYVNRYNGSNGSKFELLYGDEPMGCMRPIYDNCKMLPYMVNPNNIKVREMITSDSAQKMLGVIVDGEMRLMDLRLNDNAISRYNKNFQDMIKVIRKKTMCFMDLKPILLKAGFKERKRDTKDNPIELDLTKMDKDTLIELFS